MDAVQVGDLSGSDHHHNDPGHDDIHRLSQGHHRYDDHDNNCPIPHSMRLMHDDHHDDQDDSMQLNILAIYTHLHQHRMLQPDVQHSAVRHHPFRRYIPPLRGLWPTPGDPEPHRLCAANLDLADCVGRADAAGACLANMEGVAKMAEGHVCGVQAERQGLYLWDIVESHGMTGNEWRRKTGTGSMRTVSL